MIAWPMGMSIHLAVASVDFRKAFEGLRSRSLAASCGRCQSMRSSSAWKGLENALPPPPADRSISSISPPLIRETRTRCPSVRSRAIRGDAPSSPHHAPHRRSPAPRGRSQPAGAHRDQQVRGSSAALPHQQQLAREGYDVPRQRLCDYRLLCASFLAPKHVLRATFAFCVEFRRHRVLVLRWVFLPLVSRSVQTIRLV